MTLPYKIGAIILVCAALWWHGWNSGKTSCQNAQMKETIKTVEKVRYVRQTVDAKPAADVTSELLKWQR